MLLHLHVKNLALIDEAEVDFTEGLNILTGETGAGKSILIGSINLALGQKASKSMIREHAEYAFVELVFEAGERTAEKLKQMDIFPDDGQVIISRKLTGNRSICKINGETCTVSMVKQAAFYLLDIHGQHCVTNLRSADFLSSSFTTCRRERNFRGLLISSLAT